MSIRLILFEIRKQCTNITFLIILLLLSLFSIFQFSEVVHLPPANEASIQALERIGERKYIFVTNSDEITKSKTLDYLRDATKNGTIPVEIADQFDPVFDMLLDHAYSFEDILIAMDSNEMILPWLTTCKEQFSERLGTVEEVNDNIFNTLDQRGYSPVLYSKYVTYMQIISALLIFPIFLLLFTRDYHCNMFEVIYMQSFSSTKYLLCRFFGAFFPLSAYLYLAGLILNGIIFFRFMQAGYHFSYTPFLPYYCFYLLPTVFFLSTLLTILMHLIKKAVAVFPIYIIFVIFIVTPKAFDADIRWLSIINPIIRLDGKTTIDMNLLIANRFFCLLLGTIFLAASCYRYKSMRHNLRKVISV